jgi:hypothetical protein
VAVLLCLSVALLYGPAVLSPARAAGDSRAGVSESPSDVKPPAPKQPAAAVAKTSCQPQCEIVCCHHERLGMRLLRRFLPRCCSCCVGVPQKPCAVREAGVAEKAKPPKKPNPYAWKDLFDGKTLKGWKVPKFGGEGKVYVKDGMIVMEMGETMTGITYTGEVPRDNYELEYEGSRLDGTDFFATVTFPVGKNEVSLVTGGWGGTVVGISCVDYYDAGDNLTTRFHGFKDKQWYTFRVRVTPAKIEAWIGDEQVVDLERKGHKFDIRIECDLCRPLGFASYCTTGAVRDVRIRKLKPPAGEEAPAAEPK